MCEALSINGATVFVCRGRNRRDVEKLCKFCKVKFTSRLCDFETALGKTCDAEMCAECATAIAEDKDLCPDHAAAVKQAQLFGPTPEINSSSAEAHARAVLAGTAGPGWQLTDTQRELLRILLFHQGAQRAIPLRDLTGKLCKQLQRSVTEREIKDAARGLVVDCKVRIGASRNAQPGYYLILTAEEARDTARPLYQGDPSTGRQGERAAGSARPGRAAGAKGLRGRADEGGRVRATGIEILSERIEVCDGCITNFPAGTNAPPKGEPWEFYLFCIRTQLRKGKAREYLHARRFLTVMSARTRKALDEALREFVEREDVTVISEEEFERKKLQAPYDDKAAA